MRKNALDCHFQDKSDYVCNVFVYFVCYCNVSTAVHMISLYTVYMFPVHISAGHITAECMTALYGAIVAALYKKESSRLQYSRQK